MIQDNDTRNWNTRGEDKAERLAAAAGHLEGKLARREAIADILYACIRSGDRVIAEGNNQKQADFLSRALAELDPARVNNLHMIQPSVGRPEHLAVFEKGIAKKLDFAFSGTQSHRIGALMMDGTIEVGAIHTYIELYARLFVDLTPRVVLTAAFKADREGNLYTGPSTEDTPALVEAAAFSDGIVIAQANEIVDDVSDLDRVDIPGSWVDIVVEADRPFYIEPLFTRDPRNITPVQIFMAMMAIKGIYAEHGVTSLNHGIGFNTAAIELLLPTFGEKLGLRGRIAKNWVLNPHPTLIPAIESGWVESVHCFGTELGMERYVAARPDVFFTGADGSLRSNRAFCQLAGQYAADMFIGATLQIDPDGNSSTVTESRVSGFGGAPNLGSDARGRRHATPAWAHLAGPDDKLGRGRKLVVQMVETFQAGLKPTFVDQLDAVKVAEKAHLAVAPVMVYGDDTTHLLTEEGLAYLYKAESLAERRAMIAAVAGVTPLGRSADPRISARLRQQDKIRLPEDLGVARAEATRSQLAASSIADMVDWSGGLYDPPPRFRSW
ncbi:malonate decarboxylase subunit alpha [Salinisphaera sp. LB1]|uniref:malonate decarboxylase subunit alpha n=1 Tax=Salinisphaera sp. LB1 TaxID=2183911 RepID=UPI000D705A1A|nr:malonate decarboxylase subunit alpha [Salinisphaera sp. LB1]AWN16674.1 Malonate decarboxylase alpha subunit [Salinisphaera sp. LB1]